MAVIDMGLEQWLQSQYGLDDMYGPPPSGYPKWRETTLRQFGIDPATDVTNWRIDEAGKTTPVSGGAKIETNVYDQNGNVKGTQTAYTKNHSFLKDFVVPAATFLGPVVGGAVLASGALAGSAGAAGASGGGAGAVGTGATGGSGGLLGSAGAGVADATLPTVYVTGSSAGGGVAGLSANQVAALGAAGAGASGMSSAEKAALYGAEGYGPGMTGTQTSLYDGILGATGSPQLAGTVANSSIGSGLSNLASGLGGWGNIASLAGGLLGSTQPTSASSSVSSKIDPRMAAYLYGNGYGDPNSVLGAAQQLYAKNKTGLNSTMQQGLDMQKAALLDPAYGQAYSSMRSLGTGLLGAGVAGNPFTGGGVTTPQVTTPQVSTPQGMAPTERNMMFMGPGAQALGSGLLQGGATAQNYINSGRGLLSALR